jgi:hypothetical protein
VTKLTAGEVLISPSPLQCQEEGCGKETYFAIMVPFTTRRLCPDHLYPRLRKGSLDRLLLDLGNLMYRATHLYNQRVLEGELRAWQVIPEDERQRLPLCDPIRSLIEVATAEHYERVPLCELTEPLARMNAQAVVVAMDGGDFMQRRRAAQEQKRQRGDQDPT